MCIVLAKDFSWPNPDRISSFARVTVTVIMVLAGLTALIMGSLLIFTS